MKATWKDDKLVIETTNPGPNGSTLSVATWYLEGDSLVRESNAIMPDGTQTPARKTYYKRS
jgi:P pilus assembly chaperone PapD